MPCTGKKEEAARAELLRAGEGRDIDYVLTTREFGKILRYCHWVLSLVLPINT